MKRVVSGLFSRFGRKGALVLFGAAAATFLSGTVFAMGGKGQSAAGERGAPPVPVVAAEAARGDFPVYFQSLGTVTALNTVTVRSRVDGELVKLHFTEGGEVKAGDLLAEIDPRPYKAQLTQAEGQLLRDSALLKNARQDLRRYKVLLPQDSASPQQVDAAEAAVRQYEAAVKTDEGNIAAVKLQLEYCRVTAPLSGRLGLKLVDQGNIVRASDATGIVVITQTNPISVLFTVTEGQLPDVLSGMKQGDILVEAWDRTRTELLARGGLLTVDNRIDTATGTVRLRALFDNSGGILFPNQFVNTRIRVKTLNDAVLVPTAAVQHASRGAFVFLVENGKAVLRDITAGEGNDDLTVITKGVEPGDVLIIDGLDRLRDGVPVKAVFPGGKNGAEAPKSAPAKAGKRGEE